MTTGVAGGRPRVLPRELRLLFLGVAAVLAVAVVVPPLFELARRYEVAEAVQFSVLAMAVPALIALGAPWGRMGLSHSAAAVGAGSREAGPVDQLAYARRRHPEFVRSALFLLAFMGSVVAWRTPAAVDAVSRGDPWLVAVEAATLVAVGLAFWLELVESPPLVPRSTRPVRAVMASLAMWTVWTVAYLVGFSSSSWYSGFHHTVGHGLSTAADQQLSTVVLWFVAAVVFMPVVFWNVLQWLRSEENPDVELHRLVTQTRRWPVATRSQPEDPNPRRQSGPEP